jgi:hypothetical protein
MDDDDDEYDDENDTEDEVSLDPERWLVEDVQASITALHAAFLAGQQAHQTGAVTDRNDPRAWRAMLAYSREHPRTTVFSLLCTWRAFLLGCGPDTVEVPECVPPPGWYRVPGVDTVDKHSK